MASLEYSLVRQALMQTSYRSSMENWGGVQGLYVITPSGKVIAGGNRPWDIEFALNSLRQGLQAYQSLPRAERLLPREPDPKRDRMFPEHADLRAPLDGLVLRVTSRGFDESISDETTWRESPLAPRYYQMDRLWYTQEEALQILPGQLTRGEKKDLAGPVLEILARLYLIANGSHWNQTDVKELKLTSEVLETVRQKVKLKLSGRAVFDANDEFNQKKYRPDFLGYATFDTARRAFTEFNLIAYGMHSAGGSSAESRESKYIPLGFLFELNGTNPNDETVPTKLSLYDWVRLQCARQR